MLQRELQPQRMYPLAACRLAWRQPKPGLIRLAVSGRFSRPVAVAGLISSGR